MAFRTSLTQNGGPPPPAGPHRTAASPTVCPSFPSLKQFFSLNWKIFFHDVNRSDIKASDPFWQVYFFSFFHPSLQNFFQRSLASMTQHGNRDDLPLPLRIAPKESEFFNEYPRNEFDGSLNCNFGNLDVLEWPLGVGYVGKTGMKLHCRNMEYHVRQKELTLSII
jgi:hypothetical protein